MLSSFCFLTNKWVKLSFGYTVFRVLWFTVSWTRWDYCGWNNCVKHWHCCIGQVKISFHVKTQKYRYESPSALEGCKLHWPMYVLLQGSGCVHGTVDKKQKSIHPGVNRISSWLQTAMINPFLFSAGVSTDHSHSHTQAAVFSQLRPTFWRCLYA